MNPYDAPQADLRDDLGSGQGPAPALWNPNAAASWCLAFSVVFGAYLHMKNWEALNEPEKASASKKWFVAGICSFVIATEIFGLRVAFALTQFAGNISGSGSMPGGLSPGSHFL